MLARRLSIRQGPVKVAQRHRSERYPENPRLSSPDDFTSTSQMAHNLEDYVQEPYLLH